MHLLLYTYPFIPGCRQFFVNGKTLPVVRGAGVEQPVMAAAAWRLAAGDWVHIFPEGRVIPQGTLGPFRQGIGKLVCDAHAANGGR
jgi:monolysocardiolipin acyltransferase